MDPREFLATLWRYRMVAVLVMALTMVGAFVSLKLTKPVYEATGLVLIVKSDSTLKNLFEDRPDSDSQTVARDTNPINTQAELLKSAPLLEQVISEAKLTNRKTGKPMGVSELLKQIKITPLKGTDLIKVSYNHNDPAVAQRVVNALCHRFAENNITNARKQATETLEFLEKQIAQTKHEVDSNDHTLERFKSENKTFDLGSELSHASQELNRLKGLIRDNDVAIQEGMGRVKLLSEKVGLPPESVMASIALSSHPTIQKLQAELINAQTNPLLTSGLSEQHPEIKALRAQIKRLEEAVADEATLVAGRTMDQVQALTLDPVREKMARELLDEQIAVISTQVRQAGLKAQLETNTKQFQALPKMEQTLAKLNRDREFNVDLYKLLLQRREQARIAQAMTIGNVRVVQPAERPRSPVKPVPAQTMVGGVMMGFMLAIGTVLGLDRMDDTLRSERRTRELLGSIPITGRLPEHKPSGQGGPKLPFKLPFKLPNLTRRRKRAELEAGDAEAVPGTPPSSVAVLEAPSMPTNPTLITSPDVSKELVDEYALLRLDMVRSLGRQPRLLFAGVNEHETAYYVANIALSFAMSGRRVLLVDGDMRNPMLHHFFGLESHLGLKDLLSGEATWEDVAEKVADVPLWVIPSTSIESQPLELLDSPRLWTLNQTVISFDVVLGIAPGVTAAPDAVPLSSLFNGLWLILHHRHDTRADLAKGLAMIAERGLAVTGSLFVHGEGRR